MHTASRTSFLSKQKCQQHIKISFQRSTSAQLSGALNFAGNDRSGCIVRSQSSYMHVSCLYLRDPLRKTQDVSRVCHSSALFTSFCNPSQRTQSAKTKRCDQTTVLRQLMHSILLSSSPQSIVKRYTRSDNAVSSAYSLMERRFLGEDFAYEFSLKFCKRGGISVFSSYSCDYISPKRGGCCPEITRSSSSLPSGVRIYHWNIGVWLRRHLIGVFPSFRRKIIPFLP